MLTTKEEIISWLDKMKIENYFVNDDLTVDVEGSVNIEGDYLSKDIKELPIQFGIVKGNFNISKRGLTTLKGCPYNVYGSFKATNNNLSSLKNSPLIVTRNFNVTENKIASLEGCPEKIGGDFVASYNQLKTLEHGPKEVGESYLVENNQLSSLKHSPKIIPHTFNCSCNQLISLEYCPAEINNFSAYRNEIQSLANFHSKINNLTELWGNNIDLKEFKNLNIEGYIVLDRSPKFMPQDPNVRGTSFVKMSYQELKAYLFQMELEDILENKSSKLLPKLQ